MTAQPYKLDNPEPREVTADVVDEKIDGQVSPAADYVATVDLNEGKVSVSETYVKLDQQVGPQDENAVIVPPEGRGTHPDLGIVGKQTPEQALASGDADEVTVADPAESPDE